LLLAILVIHEEAMENIFPEVSLVFHANHHCTTGHTYLPPLPEVCYSCDQAVHYHIFDPALGWLQSEEVLVYIQIYITSFYG
jgi:hypothetical protein